MTNRMGYKKYVCTIKGHSRYVLAANCYSILLITITRKRQLVMPNVNNWLTIAWLIRYFSAVDLDW